MIGRKKEIKILESLCSETSSKLIVVEGRRRIGKTYLIDYMFKEHRNDCLYFDCAGAYDKDNKTQLKNLLILGLIKYLFCQLQIGLIYSFFYGIQFKKKSKKSNIMEK